MSKKLEDQKPSQVSTGEHKDTSANEGRVQSRRRFLTASAVAAPTVLTLPSTASATAFGSIAQCAINNDEKPDYLHLDVKDKWARKPVWAIHVVPKPETEDEQQDGWGGRRNWRPPADTKPTEEHVLVHYGRNSYIDANNGKWRRRFNGDYMGPNGEVCVESNERSERYTLAFVDDHGNLLGYKPRYMRTGHPVTGSCWVSLLPNHP